MPKRDTMARVASVALAVLSAELALAGGFTARPSPWQWGALVAIAIAAILQAVLDLSLVEKKIPSFSDGA